LFCCLVSATQMLCHTDAVPYRCCATQMSKAMSPIEVLPVLHDWPVTAGIMQVKYLAESEADALYRLQQQ
jgi:hypothetical protein